MRSRYMLLLAALCLAGCLPQQKEVIAYSGPPRSTDSLAMLKPNLWIDILSIDGDTTKRIIPLGARNSDTTVYLEPGAHRLKVYYRTTIAHALAPMDVDIYVLAGHRYLLMPDTQGSGWRGSWRAALQDMTTTPENWCVNYPTIRCRDELVAFQSKIVTPPASTSQVVQPAAPMPSSVQTASNTDMLDSAQRVSTAMGCGTVQSMGGASFETHCEDYSLAIDCDDKNVCRPMHVIKPQE
jgi:hypothetical protein